MTRQTDSRLPLGEGLGYFRRALGDLQRMFPNRLAMGCVRDVLEALGPLVVLFFSSRIIGHLSGERDLSRIMTDVLLTVSAGFLFKAACALLDRRRRAAEEGLALRVYEGEAEKFATMDFACAETSRVRELLSDLRAKQNATNMGLGRIMGLTPGLSKAVAGLAGCSVLLPGLFSSGQGGEGFLASPWLSWLIPLSLLLPLIVRVRMMRVMNRVAVKMFEEIPRLNTLVLFYRDYASKNAAKDIRIYGQQGAIRQIMRDRDDGAWITAMTRPQAKCMSFTAASTTLVSGLAYLLIGARALAGMYDLGQVTLFVGAVSQLSGYLTMVISRLVMLWENLPFLRPYYEYMDLPDGSHMGSLTTEKRSDNDYALEFHNVSFRYPGTEEYALRNVSLKLQVGRRLAVVGMNGSGKTTMIKLLCRFYEPTEGMITLNGIDIRKYKYDDYVRIFSVVFQDFKLFAMPLGQVVACGVDFDRARAERCLEAAGFGPRLRELPQGLDTYLYQEFEKTGTSISGGEAQKIALARALYRDAPFIILDEPTAALDPIAEYEVYSRFNDIVGDKTAIYISHRLSSCRFCDNIAVFHRGEIVQRGGHSELLADRSGKYLELWNAQAQYYTETERQHSE